MYQKQYGLQSDLNLPKLNKSDPIYSNMTNENSFILLNSELKDDVYINNITIFAVKPGRISLSV